ncbi:splicing factor, arginine/serine-rich 19 isoform X1 [Brachypodium distachyon]|uniref:Uncharacterized protein n=2 Tax=Brachypodium distachyon TaxID=15368 RepID=A0A0Q3GFI3_BRADI|nr:splicing factor, arginine/serine-rich 19 isoform X1 [Brachypodium distachyon]KQK09831.1 hypothetical protein BRADI_2g50420v3 [Brachypodium distachyon]|eukprot:XP_010232354.1 splicing factor, arginine/serine-rich 19 isoform X1 [Brachypodium distachyon]
MESDSDRDASLLSPAPNPSHQPFLRAAKSAAFKREERRKRKERKRQDRLALALAHWEPLGAPPRPAATASPSRAPAEDKPWPCDPPPPPDTAPSAAWGWDPPAETPPQPAPLPGPAATCPQAAAVRACRALFGEHADDEEEEEEEGEDGNLTRFFEELLEKDVALRGFYEAERETGRFMCLVCEGVGARAGKRFAGCAALVQHARSVARRTKRRLAHRSFADAVGRLLGWGAGRTTPFTVRQILTIMALVIKAREWRWPD